MTKRTASNPRPIEVECITPILWVSNLQESLRFYVVRSGLRALQGEGDRDPRPPTNYPWAFEMRLKDPNGHVLRIGSEPRAEG